MADEYDGLTKGDIVTEQSFENSGEVNSKAINKLYSMLETGATGSDGTPEFQVASMGAIPDYLVGIALGLNPNVRHEYKFGRAIGVTSSEVVVSGVQELNLPTAKDTITITSDNVNDEVGGIGARTVHIYGLDADYNEIDEIVDMGGTTVNEYLRTNRLHVETTGTPAIIGTGNNIGTITATHNGTTDPIISIEPSRGQSLSAVYTVPAGWTAYMVDANSTSSEGKAVETYLKSRDNGITDASFRTRGVRDSFQNQVGATLDLPNEYFEKTDLAITAISTAAGTSVSSAFSLILIKNA